MIEILLTSFILVFILIYYVAQRKFDYWEKRKIPFVKPSPFFGNYFNFILVREYMGQVVQKLCKQFPDAPYFGAFFGSEPVLVVQDPEVIKLIMAKDFSYFYGREISNHTHKEIRTQHMFYTYGDRWKLLRQNLSPLFTASKMKSMFPLIEECCRVFEDLLDYEYQSNNVIPVRSLMCRYTLDCVGSVAFGINTNTMAKGSKRNVFVEMGILMFQNSFYRGFKLAARAVWPAIFYGIGMKCFPLETDTFFHNLLTDVFAKRNYKPTDRNDFIDLILGLYKSKHITGESIKNMKGPSVKMSLEINDDFLVAQCILFYAGGFETSSTTMQFILYELAKNPEAQERVFKEVDEYLQRHNNKLEYDCVSEMPYTEACIDEAGRLYAVLGVLAREVMENYRLPCGAVIEKGVRVHVPVYHIHHHPAHFPDPEVFRPERFLGEEKRNIKPYTFMPFGEGHRICIGIRFGKMVILAALITLFKKYRLELAEGTPRSLKLINTTLVTQPAKAIKLKFIEREGWKQRKLA